MKRNNIYFGWYVVIAAATITLLTMGLRMGVGPFVNPVINDLGFSRTDFSMIVAIGMLVYGLGMPIAGFLIKNYSTRFVMLVGLLIVCLSILWTVNAKGPISFLFSFGVLLSFGLAFLSNIALSPIVSKWFKQQRGKALFYLSTGGMAGIAVMTPLETWLISLVGWKLTLLILGGIFVVIVIPAALFIMKEDVPEAKDGEKVEQGSKEPTQEITVQMAVKTRAYVQITFGLFACGFGMNLLGSHGVPMLVDHGYAPMTASFGIGLIGFVAIFSTIILGQLADRFPRRNILAFVYLIRGLGLIGLVLAVTNWQLYLVAAIGGLVWSGSIAMSTAILGDLYGVRLLGILNGWAFFVGHQIGAALGTYFGGAFYEMFGTHLLSFSLAGVLAILASLASITLPASINFKEQIQDARLERVK